MNRNIARVSWAESLHDSDPIDALRAQIDDIDDQLLALIEQRLSHAAALAGLKESPAPGALLIRPDREQQVVDRLTAKARSIAADRVAGIWRELMAVSLQTQQAAEIVVHAEQQPLLVADRVRQRFGCAAPLIAAMDPDSALQRARSRPSVAVIELMPLSSWWVALFQDPDLQIIDAVKDADGRILALAVGRVPPQHLGSEVRYPIISEETLRWRIAAGQRLRPLAMSGRLRLCVAEAAVREQAA